jgi:outer membrane protein assembly factor BamA
MKRIFLFLCILLPLLANAEDHYRLVRVMVTGSQRYNLDDLVRATGLSANSQVVLNDLQGAATRLGNSGAFTSVQFTFKPAAGPRGVEADFEVKDADQFLSVVFENLIWFSDQDLQQALHQELPLYNGTLPTSGSMTDDVSAALTKLLAAKGLPSSVSYMPAGELGRPISAYRYKVENAGLKIESVHIAEASHMPADLLAKSIASLQGQEYQRSGLSRAFELSLTPLYAERGFLKFKIIEVKAALSPNGGVVLEVPISEGEQYRLAGYDWTGNTLISSEELSKQITLKPGELVNFSKLNHDLAQVRRLFGKYGREAATITPVPTYGQGTVTYSFSVREGDLYRMGKLEIDGFDAETTRKLTESWKLPDGAAYDRTYMQKFLISTLPLAHGRQREWLVLEQVDGPQKTVNVRLQIRAE